MERRNFLRRNIYNITKYLKVSDKKAIQMEIHRTNNESSQRKSSKKVERRHLKEIESLLRDIITKRIENEDNKSKNTSTEAKIITGEMIRLGYTFKNKRENQILLLSDESDEDDFFAHSLKIHKEKLVVFYYSLEEPDSPGSTACMSQMLRALNDGNLSQSQAGTVSISSYFQKKNPSCTAVRDNKTESTSERINTESTDGRTKENMDHHKEDFSGCDGKHHAIKKMVKRCAPALSRRMKRRNVVATNSKAADVYDFDDSRDSMDTKNNFDSVEVSNDECDQHTSTEPRLSSEADGQCCQDRGSPSKILAEIASRNCTDFDHSSRSSSGESLTDRIRDKNIHVSDSSGKSSERDSSVVIESDSSSTCAVDTTFFKQNNNSKSGSNPVTMETSSNESNKLKPDSDEMEDSGRAQLTSNNSYRDTLLNSYSELPEISFLKRTSKSLLENQREGTLNTDSSDNSDTEVIIQDSKGGPDSPKFDRAVGVRARKRPSCVLNSSTEDSVCKEQGGDKRSKLKRQRVKHTLPEFSTDQSEDIDNLPNVEERISSKDVEVNEWDGLPVLSSSRNSKREKNDKNSNKNTGIEFKDEILTTVSHQDEAKPVESSDPMDQSGSRKIVLFKRPRTNNVKKDTKPRVFSFKKSSNSSKVKRQSILNFLTLSQQQEPCEEEKDEVEGDGTDSGSLDCVIIDGLDDLREPEFKDDESKAIENEMNDLRKVDELNEQQLHYLVMKNKVYLQDIFSGKIASDRHEVYRQGGKARRDLNHHVHLGLFTEDQLDVVMETLMSIFCKKHHKYLEYIMKVLLPETLIKIYMDHHNVSHDRAEEGMLEALTIPGGIHI
ncbi:uncharacterized protein LOC133183101 [Saccostrea echinata]|uniref:uncharacterized protein LOC133183101 n=1 Tax=Saccostrea echinata TaxID=191078 RepID=UPI002A80DB5E|nr:uncharacterized protein LOC133183101 [Saccostrea echinata]